MKIKYSNQIKEQLSKVEIKALIQLGYSIIPFENLHIFKFQKTPEGKSTITHFIPNIDFESNITVDSFSEVSERIIMYKYSETLYLFLENESPIKI